MMTSWVRVWIQPGEVTREKIEGKRNETLSFLLVAVFGAIFSFLLIDQINRDFDVSFNLWIASTIGLIVSPILFTLSAWFVAVIGRWMGGEGLASDVRIALLWGQILPSVAIWGIRLVEFLINGEASVVPSSRDQSLANMVVAGLSIWIWVLSLQAVAEAHRFSAWKSLLIYIIFILFLFLFQRLMDFIQWLI